MTAAAKYGKNPLDCIVLYDGACGFCNRAVRFVLAHERQPWCRFAALQSPAGRELVRAAGRDPDRLDTLYLWTGKTLLERSDAALAIAYHLRAPWRWLTVFRHLPRRWRDALYDAFARRRYRWFGQQTTCLLPAGANPARFLTQPVDPSPQVDPAAPHGAR
ncbi:MAG: DCC1-like thiol-disulfide oxidoreductase family protein [Kiritimatiellae bacterium]|nr:DCC1-like thiol-disulfide oxidoreductase family protein [Kiritimatiellia bacterium]MDW8458811.1 DCC1-like thiol-disulfide oxidoreductase family protein [Verrucomicrobiota bacterium]